MPNLRIQVIAATGRGPTSLAAFDDALASAGISNFNLVRLSSVIPPGSRVVPSCTSAVSLGDWGDRLYAVWAFEKAELLGQEAWAGVAWVQDPTDGRGLFVEHEGGSESIVREELRASLTFLCESRGMPELEQHSVVVGDRCEGTPVCALVIAPFASEDWPQDHG